MTEETLQFLIMVDCDKGREHVLGAILRKFPDAQPIKLNSCEFRGNWVEVWGNEAVDDRLSEDKERGYLGFRWRVEVTPMLLSVEEDFQIQLARALRDCFEQDGCKAVVCANFEDKI